MCPRRKPRASGAAATGHCLLLPAQASYSESFPLWPIAGVLWAAAGFALLGAGAIAARDIGGMAKELGDIRDSWAERAYGGYVPAFRGPAFGRLVGVAYLFGGAILVVLGVGLIVVH